jgi:signal transduction histidine kinase
MKGEIEVALKEPRSQEEYQTILRSTLEEVDTLQSIVKNLLMLTYLEKESLRTKFTPQNLDDVLLKAIEDLIIIGSQKNIIFEIGTLESLVVNGDEILLKTVFSNLIENAIKYSPNHTTVSLSLTSSNRMACFHIEDEGNGIDEEKLSLIFERFYRADDSRSKQIKGFGLGLSIVQQIVDVHDGIIHVKNRKPKGLEIEVMLPLVS